MIFMCLFIFRFRLGRFFFIKITIFSEFSFLRLGDFEDK